MGWYRGRKVSEHVASFVKDGAERKSNSEVVSAVLCVRRCSDNAVQVVTLLCHSHCPIYVHRFGAAYEDVSGEAPRPAALAAELLAL